jgi:hypothetical protein
MISPEQLEQVIRLIETEGLSEHLVSRLRAMFPGTHFTYCLDDDIVGVEPVRQGSTFNLYLVDGRPHCVRLTSDWQGATGVVLAEVPADPA